MKKMFLKPSVSGSWSGSALFFGRVSPSDRAKITLMRIPKPPKSFQFMFSTGMRLVKNFSFPKLPC